MELYPLKVFLTVATEKSFSRAAEKLLRTQPAISLAIQKLESDLQEKLIDRSGKELLLTDAGRIVYDYARRFENLEADLENALAELRDNSAGRLIVGANESTSLYLLGHIERYRRLYPKVKVQVRRSLSSKIPVAVDRRRSGARRDQLRPGRRAAAFDGDLSPITWRLSFRRSIVSPIARKCPSTSWAWRHSSPTMFLSPYRAVVLKEFQRHKVPLNMDVEMPTVETIRKMVQRNEGVAFLPRMCVEQDVEAGRVAGDQGEGAESRPQYPPGVPGEAEFEPRREGVFGVGEGRVDVLCACS